MVMSVISESVNRRREIDDSDRCLKALFQGSSAAACPCGQVTPGVSTEGMPDPSTLPCFNYHQDSGMEKDLEYRPAPRFSMKAGCA
eukprot:COSAG04_NODE_2887_length_3420_cov_2.535682_5_plen_86_part_00